MLRGAAASRGRATLTSRTERIRERFPAIAQTALAAGLAWFAATRLWGHRSPAFAAIAAVVAIGESVAHRHRRAVELFLGVSLGIGVGDVLANLIGTGPLQLAAVIALAMLAATVLGGGALIVSEAAVSAVLVVLVVRDHPGISPNRFLDALTGCAVAYLVAVVFPRDIGRMARGAADPVFAGLAELLDHLSQALARGDEGLAALVLADAEAAGERQGALDETLDDLRGEVRFSPGARRRQRRLAAYAGAAPQSARMLRNVHALSRAAVRLLRSQEPGPPALAGAVSDLAWAMRLLARALVDGEGWDETLRLALRASDEAATAAEDEADVGVGIAVDTVRAIAFDVVRAAGLGAEDAEALLQGAA